jgi:hypothetical protein
MTTAQLRMYRIAEGQTPIGTSASVVADGYTFV